MNEPTVTMTGDEAIRYMQLKKAILKEWEGIKTGQQYIENASDAFNFVSHLAFLVTNGSEGEERASFSEGYDDESAEKTGL